MQTISIHDAKTNLSKYIAAAKRGETIAIGAYGRQEVWLTNTPPTGTSEPKPKRQFGTLRGKVWVSSDAFGEKTDTSIARQLEESDLFPQ